MKLQSFFDELSRLLNLYPHVLPHIVSSENCDYGNNIFHSKNLSFCFECAHCADSDYLFDCYMTPSSIDCDYCAESELCYESLDTFKCYNSSYLENCGSTRDSMYSYNCINCQNVFGCVDLQNKSFCLFNRQLSEAEYHAAVQIYKNLPAEKVLGMLEELKKRYPVTQTNEAHNENSSYGNYVYFNKNCYLCFDAAHNEECSYLYDSFYNKTSYDLTYSAQNNQLCYEVVESGNLFNCNYAVYCNGCNDSSFIFNCKNVKDCLGCISLANKQYCILNRQLTKEDYDRVKTEFLSQLNQKKVGWGNITYTS